MAAPTLLLPLFILSSFAPAPTPAPAPAPKPRPVESPAPPTADPAIDAAAQPATDQRTASSPPADRYAEAANDHGAARRGDWWRSFGDARLDELVKRGRAQSFDVAAATSRIDEANAVVRQNLAPLLPQLTWDTSVNVAPLDTLGFQFGGAQAAGSQNMGGAPAEEPPTLYYVGSSALNLGVEIDLAGTRILARRASQHDLGATQADLEAAKLSVTASIVAGYFDVVTATAQLEISQRQVATNQEVLALTETRFALGQANAVDVLQQRQQVASAQTLVPKAKIQLRAFEQRLAVLLGQAPGAAMAIRAELPSLPPQPAVGRPSQLVSARPDLRAQRERLEGAKQRERSSKRAFVPSLRLSGQSGVQFIDIGDFRSQWFWNIGAALSIPLYDGGTKLARLRQSEAQSRTASHQFSGAVLNATREVEDALLREREQAQVVTALRAQVDAAQSALTETRRRYQAGLGQYLPVLTALNTAHQAELSLITAQRDLLAARIALHQALGDTPAS